MAEDEAGHVAKRHHGAIRQVPPIRDLLALGAPLCVQDDIHLVGTGESRKAVAARKGVAEGDGVGAPALEAGAVTGRERRRLVEEEERSIALPEHLVLAALEGELA